MLTRRDRLTSTMPGSGMAALGIPWVSANEGRHQLATLHVGVISSQNEADRIVDRGYPEYLSPVSLGLLPPQGGTLLPVEVSWLEGHPWFADAVRIGRWDDHAKDRQATYPPLEA